MTLELDAATIVGDVDYLSATGDGYLVIDDKTSDLSTQSVDRLTEHYLPQLLAYAGALFQGDAAERVEVALAFTDTGDVRRRTLSRNDVTELLAWADDVLDPARSP